MTRQLTTVTDGRFAFHSINFPILLILLHLSYFCSVTISSVSANDVSHWQFLLSDVTCRKFGMQDLAVKPGNSNSEQQQACNINVVWSSRLGLSAVNRIYFGAQQTRHNTTQTQHNRHNTTQHGTTQHNRHNTTQTQQTQHNTTHNTTGTTQHGTTQHKHNRHNTTQHGTTQHNTTQHWCGSLPINRHGLTNFILIIRLFNFVFGTMWTRFCALWM